LSTFESLCYIEPMSRLGLFTHSAVPLGLIMLSHSWSAESTEVKPLITPVLASNFQAAAGAWDNRSSADLIHRQGEKPLRYHLAITPVIGRRTSPDATLIRRAAADESSSGNGASQLSGPPSKTANSGQTKPAMTAMLAVETAVVAKAPVSDSTVNASAEEEPSTPKSPSILQMLEGREQDLVIAVAIALAFFVVGWFCGGIYHLRRDRRRRTKLRF
jgi:hypothetical protein